MEELKEFFIREFGREIWLEFLAKRVSIVPIENYSREDYIVIAFNWGDDYKLWSDVHTKWIHYLEESSLKYSPKGNLLK